MQPANDQAEHSTDVLRRFAAANGDISSLLDASVVTELGVKAVREWRIDQGSRETWLDNAERYLAIAAQEHEDIDGDYAREPIWEDGSDIHYPILTTATQQFSARAYPEIVKGDHVVGIKVFNPPPIQPGPMEAARAQVPNPDPQQAQQIGAAVQQAQAGENQQSAIDAAKNARAERVKHYMNFQIFYKMDNWEGETDALLHEVANLGIEYKKVYFDERGLQSDFASSMRVCVHNDARSLYRVPRITQDFDVYPYEVEERVRAGIYQKMDLPQGSEDDQAPRLFIEAHRLDDLDGDGLSEPYIVTVDVDTMQVARVEPAYSEEDIIVNPQTMEVMRIERWLPYAPFLFLPDPKARWHGIGFGRLLDTITESIDTSLNQLIDAGHAEIAGGGFIASGVRLQGSGAGGAAYFQPGEYGVVNLAGGTLRDAIWERTVPHPSAVTMQLMELLLGAAKDISSVKDVITGDAPNTAPVGTTLALQNAALQVFSSIYKRIYRGFRDEFRLMYKALKRWATDKERAEYKELTGGDFDQDFSGDGTDIQPVADPSVVTKMQKVARLQTLLQIAETPVGQAAGMTQPGPAQEIVRDILEDLDYERPDRFLAEVPPNPELVAKTQDMRASAQLKAAQAEVLPIKTQIEAHKAGVDATKTQAETALTQAKALQTMGDAAMTTHELHKEASRIEDDGQVHESEPEGDEGGSAGAKD